MNYLSKRVPVSKTVIIDINKVLESKILKQESFG